MDNINSVISGNLKRLREEKKLSLDAVAKLSGVSKSMLGQIERGSVNPTLSTVWKITRGLKIPFSELTIKPEADYEVVNKPLDPTFVEDGGRYRVYPKFPFDSERRFEIHYVEIDPGGDFNSEPHLDGTQEFITSFAGKLALIVHDEEFIIEKGGSIRFKADCPHRYINIGDEMCLLCISFYYP